MQLATKSKPQHLKPSQANAYRQLLCRLAFWKDADPDIPTLKESKAEYAELQ